MLPRNLSAARNGLASNPRFAPLLFFFGSSWLSPWVFTPEVRPETINSVIALCKQEHPAIFRNSGYRVAPLPCPANSPINHVFLFACTDFRTRLDGRSFGLKPGFPDRAGMSRSAPLPDQRP